MNRSNAQLLAEHVVSVFDIVRRMCVLEEYVVLNLVEAMSLRW